MRLCNKFIFDKFYHPKPQLNITKDVHDFIIKTTMESPKVETGGILMGQDIKPLTVNVSFASLPGPNAFHSPTKFVRDTDYCTKVLREHYDKYSVDYVGEWHSHVVPLRKASFGDIATISSIMFDPDYNFNAFACIIALLNDNNVNLIGYITTKGYFYQTNINIK